uniref:Alphaaminoadipic semialdehyde synthase putative n=1 Tax=Albugo laibachii Nc14 TaxID=890382 RepID=F0WRP4_9STRA|nr:alphaaminoadipic semialdehyde synthase putative [Albugo laibachii Nc14]|eukprot:CCA24008.1 alphaaminoadipic semialdehyde synthase putative [Albugo laibachii Nc14]
MESSQHSGEKLMPFLDMLTSVSGPLELMELLEALKGGCIVSNGAPTLAYEYIDRVRVKSSRRSASYKWDQSASCCARLEGHLFDTGLINKILDLVELEHGDLHLLDCKIRPSNFDGAISSISSAILRLNAEKKE